MESIERGPVSEYTPKSAGKVLREKFIMNLDVNDEHCFFYNVFDLFKKKDFKNFKALFETEEFSQVFDDLELIKSMEAFFDNNLNISETARELFMHRNTLMYRVDKVRRLTGFNLYDFNNAVAFKFMITLHNRLIKK